LLEDLSEAKRSGIKAYPHIEFARIETLGYLVCIDQGPHPIGCELDNSKALHSSAIKRARIYIPCQRAAIKWARNGPSIL